jgi:predicted phage terminase large subunit-like protein
LRWPVYKSVPDLVRIVVAIDPATTSGEDADETGIIVAGKDAEGRGYVLADRSGHYTPTEWAQAAIALYRQHKADRIVAEVNNGGQMVENTIRMISPDGPNIPYTAVYASRGKVVRAEPVAALYEQQPGRVYHVGAFPTLEDQMCAFTTDLDRKAAGLSPDRADALVWALTDLLVEPIPGAAMIEYYRQRAREATEKKAAAAAVERHPAT